MVLKLWTYDTFDGDYFVAESAEEADAMLKEYAGFDLAELVERDGEEAAWEAMPDDKSIRIRFDVEMFSLPAGVHEMATTEWCKVAGKGYLFSMNY